MALAPPADLVPPSGATSVDQLVALLKAAADPGRLRLIALLSKSQLAVNEITQVVGQSQPTVSRQLKALCDAGLVERSPEGAWVFYRVPDEGPGAILAEQLVGALDAAEPLVDADKAALDDVRRERNQTAAAYFAQNAAEWTALRELHVENEDVERAMVQLTGDRPIARMLDIGTGTGRILEVMAPLVDRGVGLDVSHQMLSIARANLAQAGLRRSSVRHGSLYQPPFPDRSFDFVTMHQVLHFLEDPAAAIKRTARLLEPAGRILIVDFAPHELEYLRSEHEHRRLGIHGEEIAQWADRAGLMIEQDKTLHPPIDQAQSLTVRLWMLSNQAAPEGNINRLRAV